jgi:hypothetical protein
MWNSVLGIFKGKKAYGEHLANFVNDSGVSVELRLVEEFQGHKFFVFHLEFEDFRWKLRFRYSDIRNFHKKLASKMGTELTLEIPPRWGNRSDAEKREILTLWMRVVFGDKKLWEQAEVREFGEFSNSSFDKKYTFQDQDGYVFICTQEPANEPLCVENFSFKRYLDVQPAHLSRFVSFLLLSPPPPPSLRFLRQLFQKGKRGIRVQKIGRPQKLAAGIHDHIRELEDSMAGVTSQLYCLLQTPYRHGFRGCNYG